MAMRMRMRMRMRMMMKVEEVRWQIELGGRVQWQQLDR
jgi:hypothetical protein